MGILVLGIAFVIILAGAELFTNSIEWFGRKLGLARLRGRNLLVGGFFYLAYLAFVVAVITGVGGIGG